VVVVLGQKVCTKVSRRFMYNRDEALGEKVRTRKLKKSIDKNQQYKSPKSDRRSYVKQSCGQKRRESSRYKHKALFSKQRRRKE